MILVALVVKNLSECRLVDRKFCLDKTDVEKALKVFQKDFQHSFDYPNMSVVQTDLETCQTEIYSLYKVSNSEENKPAYNPGDKIITSIGNCGIILDENDFVWYDKTDHSWNISRHLDRIEGKATKKAWKEKLKLHKSS